MMESRGSSISPWFLRRKACIVAIAPVSVQPHHGRNNFGLVQIFQVPMADDLRVAVSDLDA